LKIREGGDPIHPKQQAILDFIYNYPHQYPPTIHEIKKEVGLKTISSVDYHLLELERQGYRKLRVYQSQCIETK